MNLWIPILLLKLAKTSNYGTLADSLIRDRIVVGINDNSARKKLLQAGKLILSQCINICRSSETSARQLKTMNQEDVRLVKEEKVKLAGKKKSGVSDNRPCTEFRKSRMTCKFCARQHPFRQEEQSSMGNHLQEVRSPKPSCSSLQRIKEKGPIYGF